MAPSLSLMLQVWELQKSRRDEGYDNQANSNAIKKIELNGTSVLISIQPTLTLRTRSIDEV